MKKIFLACSVLLIVFKANAQAKQEHNPYYWQQHVDYKMEVDMNVENFRYDGKQELVYTNNSPEVLDKVFYHLYFNAFQPGSEMDVRLKTIADPDRRMVTNKGTKEEPDYESRIGVLKPDETGYIKVHSLAQDGQPVTYEVKGTVLEVKLAKPIEPGASSKFVMSFEGQVPLQIRRSGRNSEEGVALSMTQWFPKMAEYDFEGWHADPYIGREFHGVWGNFDVKITIDKDYVLGGTGYLQNGDEIGYGYEKEGTKVKRHKGKKLTWHFIAPDVHDFAWAADPEFLHDTLKTPGGTTLHFLYKNNPDIVENWKKLQPKTAQLLDFYNKNIGPYPWKQYSVIQGGDGGMEYAMCTLITGERSFGSLVGVTAHEMAHAWFQHLLATNESKHPWMDEGFTSFISALAENEVMERNKPNPFENAYRSYFMLVQSGKEQPQTTHGDRYAENMPYSFAAYSKGEIFLAQLGYIIGQDKLMETLHQYYEDFKFKHPTPNDFKRVAEKVSGFNLDWYLTDWTMTTNTIDYGIKEVAEEGNKTKVTLERIGLMPMPVDVLVVYKDESYESFYAPLRMMYGEKENPYPNLKRTVLPDWAWAYPTYEFTIDRPKSDIKAIVIDPSELMADVDKSNNGITYE
ncbi:M1 family metallopeptidase [Sinomicrobium weinanense]|uniref:M1 family metallopeptidase n=1 Tax=Sinomicrobium weinanense TaxID=2842200 RepID=A0A926Q2E5_9FLAO|nr:M1 family metallopeptidase [Sinomicrobium weinanense]MBC9794590.1 M1 family metallopeptidase [Sinomicrobium weinanense]MBU3124075.1 M1 family metallopeptidase [Sinomicrobium weinanense]